MPALAAAQQHLMHAAEPGCLQVEATAAISSLTTEKDGLFHELILKVKEHQGAEESCKQLKVLRMHAQPPATKAPACTQP